MRTGPRLTADRGALLVVDLQIKLAPAIERVDRVIANVVRLVGAASLLNLPTFATEQVPSKLGPTVPALADLLPVRLPKATFHAGGADGLWGMLEAAQIQHVALVGIEAHICVGADGPGTRRPRL